MEAVVLHRVGFLAYFCPKQGQDFKPSAAPLYPNMGQVPPPGPQTHLCNTTPLECKSHVRIRFIYISLALGPQVLQSDLFDFPGSCFSALLRSHVDRSCKSKRRGENEKHSRLSTQQQKRQEKRNTKLT